MLARLESEGVKSKTLATSHAFHSHRMEPILDELAPGGRIGAVLAAADRHHLQPHRPGGRRARPTPIRPIGAATPARPCGSPRASRRWPTAAANCSWRSAPAPRLIGMARRCLPDGDYAWLPSLRPGRDDWQTMLDSLAQLYVRGAKIDWAGFDRDYRPRQRRSCRRIRSSGSATGPRRPKRPPQRGPSAPQRGGRVLHPLLGRRLVAATSEQVFESQLAANRPAMLGDHKIQGMVVMPAAGYLEMALAASAVVHGKPWNVCGATLSSRCCWTRRPRRSRPSCRPRAPSAARSASSASRRPTPTTEPTFTTLATGRLESPRDSRAPNRSTSSVQRSRFTGEPRDEAWQIEALRESGLEPGPTFRWTCATGSTRTKDWPSCAPPQDERPADDYQIHPGLLDSGFQLLGGVLPGAGEGIDAYVPMGVDRIQVLRSSSRGGLVRGLAQSLKGKAGRRRRAVGGRLGPRAGEARGRAAAARAARLAGPAAGRTAARLVLRVGVDAAAVGRRRPRSSRRPSAGDG